MKYFKQASKAVVLAASLSPISAGAVEPAAFIEACTPFGHGRRVYGRRRRQ